MTSSRFVVWRRELWRTCRTLLVVIVAFLIFWTPYAVVIAFDHKDRFDLDLSISPPSFSVYTSVVYCRFPLWVHLWATYWAHMHSTANFWIYMATNREYRIAFARLLGMRNLADRLATVETSVVTSSTSGAPSSVSTTKLMKKDEKRLNERGESSISLK